MLELKYTYIKKKIRRIERFCWNIARYQFPTGEQSFLPSIDSCQIGVNIDNIFNFNYMLIVFHFRISTKYHINLAQTVQVWYKNITRVYKLIKYEVIYINIYKL